MFTERKPSHRESLLGRWGLGAAESHRGSRKMGHMGLRSTPAPFSLRLPKGSWVALDRGSKVSIPPKEWEAPMGSYVLLLKIQREGGPGKG